MRRFDTPPSGIKNRIRRKSRYTLAANYFDGNL